MIVVLREWMDCGLFGQLPPESTLFCARDTDPLLERWVDQGKAEQILWSEITSKTIYAVDPSAWEPIDAEPVWDKLQFFNTKEEGTCGLY